MWQNIALVAVGFAVGLLAGYSIKKEPTTINADTYIEAQTQETKVGKIKQKKGEDNQQQTEVKPKFLSFLKKKKANSNNQKTEL